MLDLGPAHGVSVLDMGAANPIYCPDGHPNCLHRASEHLSHSCPRQIFRAT
jgi:hypothetical protein